VAESGKCSSLTKILQIGAAPAPPGADGWRVYLTDDEPPEAAVYCPDGAEREFSV
jgi:hypothetical protein